MLFDYLGLMLEVPFYVFFFGGGGRGGYVAQGLVHIYIYIFFWGGADFCNVPLLV